MNWSKQYENAKYILSYLNSYPDVLSTIKLTDIYNPNSIDSALKEWIWLCSKLTHPVDTEFFKPYWIPLQENSYDYFMDISDEKYPIFEIHYFFYEPFKWYKKFISEDISELLLANDTGLDLKQLLGKNERIRWRQVDAFFAERKRLAFQGKLHVKEVILEEIIFDSDCRKNISFNNDEFSIRITGVTSLIVGLLPYELAIKLKKIEYKYGKPYLYLENVKIIRDLVFLLRDTGILRVASYRVDFVGFTNSYIEFKEGEFILYNSERNVLDDFSKECKLKKL
jgi:hypothetical protein